MHNRAHGCCVTRNLIPCQTRFCRILLVAMSCVAIGGDAEVLIRPAQESDELECTRLACLRRVVIVNQCQASSPRLTLTGSSLLGNYTYALRLTIKAEKPNLLRLNQPQIARLYFIGWYLSGARLRNFLVRQKP